ncbi:MAG: hypothetical protein ACREBW_07780, partial [Candidatus Micrarchaeaceae archaeon]
MQRSNLVSREVDEAVDSINTQMERGIKFLDSTIDSEKYSWKMVSVIAKTHTVTFPILNIAVVLERKDGAVAET